MEDDAGAPAAAAVHRLSEAMNAHDLDALVGCFAEAYRNEAPAHPARGFVGRGQVRRNWEQIFAGVPDLRVRILRSTSSENAAWTEWELDGVRRDGAPFALRGVTITGVDGDGLIAWARFYLEPLDAGDGSVDAAVREHTGVA